jgi:hypothetical protein
MVDRHMMRTNAVFDADLGGTKMRSGLVRLHNAARSVCVVVANCDHMELVSRFVARIRLVGLIK